MKPNLLLKGKDDGDCPFFPCLPSAATRAGACRLAGPAAVRVQMPSHFHPLPPVPRRCFLWAYFSLISATASVMDIPTSGVRKNKPLESLWKAKVLCSTVGSWESTRNEMLAPCGPDQNMLDGVRADCRLRV